MAVETGFLDVGFCISAGDYRNSTLNGTTWAGPNGSGQFLFVSVSTVSNTNLTVALSSAASTVPVFGVLQNKPSTGLAADVKMIGVSKVVLGSTVGVAGVPTPGARLTISTVTTGAVTLMSTVGTAYVGISLESPSTTGTVFSAVIYSGIFPTTYQYN